MPNSLVAPDATNPFAGSLDDLGRGTVALVGVGVDANSSYLRGSAAAPAAVREQLHCGSANYCSESGADLTDVIVDLGDVAVSNTAASVADADMITQVLRSVVATGAAPLTIGGDHSVTYPVLRALGPAHNDLHIVHIDAHPDLYDSFEDNRFSHASPFARIMEDQLCSNLTQIGIRTATPHQREQAARFAITTVTASEFSQFDLGQVCGPVYVSIDLDGLDPAFAPGVSHHEPGGLTVRQVIDLLSALATKDDATIVGADVVELNPGRDLGGMTAMVAAKLTRELAAALAT